MIDINKNNRIDYIDVIKGFVILWVVALHTSVPQTQFDWLYVPYRMPLFFIISGIFFKVRPLKEFILKRINTLLLPFIIWFVISWLFMLLKYEFVSNYLSISIDAPESTWGAVAEIFGLFNISNTLFYSPIEAVQNAPLWFLIALFNVQMIFYFIKKLTKNNALIITIAATLFITGHMLLDSGINGPFILPTSCSYLIYFALGSIYGKPLLEFIKNTKIEIVLGTVSLLIFVSLTFVNILNISFITQNLIILVRSLCLAIMVVVFFHNTYQWLIFKPFSFFGKNTLPLLCTHMLVKFTVYTALVKILNLSILESSMTMAVIFQLILIVVVCIVEYFIIKFCNRYMPYTVGKKDILVFK